MIYLMGPHLSMDITEYHNHQAVSKSKLDSIALSPLHYWSRWLDPNRTQPQPTPAMEFGTAVHTAVLEPDRFATEYRQAPDLPKTTKAGKDAWAAAAADGHKLLRTDDWCAVQGILRSVFEHPMARKALLASGSPEQSLFATCRKTGLELKARPDYLTDSGWIIDLKTTQDASTRGFQKSAANFRYHVQAAHYLNVYKLATGEHPKGFIFIAVEKVAPFAVQVFEASPNFVQVGMIEAQRNLQALAHALQSYDSALPWPSYSDAMVQLDPPSWLSPQLPEM